MSEYIFGTGHGKVSERERKRIDGVCANFAFNTAFSNPTLPEGPRYWFSADNRGEPFDGKLAAAVLAKVGKVKTVE